MSDPNPALTSEDIHGELCFPRPQRGVCHWTPDTTVTYRWNTECGENTSHQPPTTIYCSCGRKIVADGY